MKYQTKIRVVEAFRWQGQPKSAWPEWATQELVSQSGIALYAYTTRGPARVNKGDWCILGNHEVYPCTDEEFRERYEPITYVEGA